ncbi:MAG: AMP-binding protein [Sphingomonas sp.]
MDWWDNLASHKDRSALIGPDFEISYAELAVLADKFCAELQAGLSDAIPRPLILLEASNEPAAIIAYLGALRARWPVILVAEGAADDDSEIAQIYRPNVILRRVADWKPVFATSDAIEMHPDLAVLLSTSGTTGAAKLVRLSRQNLSANANAIARYLDVRTDDRAMTLLPFHYSYGMSVLHIHLLRGAGLVLTNGSLIDADLRALATRTQVCALALVPAQFELIDTLDWVPKLRYVTQAGGRLDPVLAKQFADKAAAEGWQLFIMYGQTEAAPRMSYVPPQEAQLWFHTIGRPLEGGRFRLVDAEGQEIAAAGTPGELVYEGPNVMLGYAVTRSDLGAPAGPKVLHTGDIAERLENGYFRITGRASRFIKLFGLRIGLDEVETQLRAEGRRVYVTGSDLQLVVFVQDDADLALLRDSVARRYHLPNSAVVLAPIKGVPLLPSGKVDYRLLTEWSEALQSDRQAKAADTQSLLRQALRMPVVDLDRSFLELGGDSLAYLEVQLHLLERLGKVPADWETLPLCEVLAQGGDTRSSVVIDRPRRQPVRAELVARIASILAVIALHSTAWPTGGGSYLLLILVGYSLARFQSAVLFEGNILRTWHSMLVPILTCYYFLLLMTTLLWHPVSISWFMLLGNFQEAPSLRGLEPYWFVSAYVQIIVLFTLPIASLPLRREIARRPLVAGLLALAAMLLAIHFTGVAEIAPQSRQRHPLAAMELLLLGWCIFYGRDRAQKAMMTLVTLVVWWITWRDAPYSAHVMVLCGAIAVTWGLWVNLPVRLARGLMQMGSLTLFLYIVHPPIISLVVHLGLRSDGVSFVAVMALSLAAAGSFKFIYDRVNSGVSSRLARGATKSNQGESH